MSRNEADTRVELIDPALLLRGWTPDLVRIERTVGGADIVGGRPYRRPGRVDYLLCLPAVGGAAPLPVAILEAKSEDKLPGLGLQQAQNYRTRFRVPFAFSSNGHLFAEWAEDTQQVAPDRPIAEFPTPTDLMARFEAIRGLSLTSDAAAALFVPYRGGESARYYFQDAAVRATLERIAAGGDRALISLATGTGKTVVAAQLLHKLSQAGQLRRALFLVDRDELRTQGWARLRAVFGDSVQVVTTSEPCLNARVLVASYQTLNVESDDLEPTFWHDNYPADFFSHIVIDECHRSAWGKWSVVLRDNPEAVHIGLTATPRSLKPSRKATQAHDQDAEITAHNIEYFGEPVYEYPIWQAQEDGFLAASEIVRRVVDLDQSVITKADIEARTATDPYTGQTIDPDDLEPAYPARRYEQTLMLPDRVTAMCEDLFDHLLATGGPLQKTIVFCVRDAHAMMVADALNNLYSIWCQTNGASPAEMYAFRCTGSPDLRPPAADLIPDLRGSSTSHFIATTVSLLATGVDIPNLQNVVFFQYLDSPIEFYQRVGRGTRTGEPLGSKLMFRIYDYTNATRLFGHDFLSRARPSTTGDGEPGPSPGPEPQPRLIRVEGFSVEVIGAGRSILVEENGRESLIPVEQYERRLAAAVSDAAADIDEFRRLWVLPHARRALLEGVPGDGAGARAVRALRDQADCDLYDVMAELAFGTPARSRAERVAAFSFRHRGWLQDLPPRVAGVLRAIASQFEGGGIDELERVELFDTPAVQQAGGFAALTGFETAPDGYIESTKLRLLAA
jgi:type I restriction enzyme R subunit